MAALRPTRPTTLLALLLLLALAACAPRAAQTPGAASPAEEQLRRTAELAYHRMQIGYLETGTYTTNALVDLELPRGVRWTLESFSEDDYRLRFTADDLPDAAWLVTPAGTRPAPPTPLAE